MPQHAVRFTTVASPIGELLLTAEGEGLTGLYLPPHEGATAPRADWRRDEAALRTAAEQLDAYWAGERTEFDLPLALRGTAFQRRVWAALVEVPYGATVSYGELARRIGAPGAARAVGLANGRNPVSVVVPCHRVVGADGSLTGYAAGIGRKRHLLALEADVLARRRRPPPGGG